MIVSLQHLSIFPAVWSDRSKNPCPYLGDSDDDDGGFGNDFADDFDNDFDDDFEDDVDNKYDFDDDFDYDFDHDENVNEHNNDGNQDNGNEFAQKTSFPNPISRTDPGVGK